MERTNIDDFDHDESKVRRKIEVVLKDGQNDVEIKNLPTCLEEDSIRVDGIGNATIFDVIYRESASRDKDDHTHSFKFPSRCPATL